MLQRFGKPHPKLQATFWTLMSILLLGGLWFAWVELEPWRQERRVNALIKQMTLEEKIRLIGGYPYFFTHDIPRLGIPIFQLSDGPFGVSEAGPATVMAGGITLAATWNPDLAQRVGTELGRDARSKGIHFLLGPGVNIYTSPVNGRNFEYFGEDPFLASRMAVSYIQGVQSQDVAATIKHYIANHAEYDRVHLDTLIDERSLREIFMPPFEAAVKEARVGAVMASYNVVNGVHMTQHKALNVDVLKKEWGFDGILMSDWVSTHDAMGAVKGGLDLEMPSAKQMNAEKLLPALARGEITVAEIDEKVRRILRTALRFGWLDRPQTDLSLSRYNVQGSQMALETAREGMVLLKNERNLLPLRKGAFKTIAVLGPNAAMALPTGGGSARVQPFGASSFYHSLRDHLGSSAQVLYAQGIPSLNEMAEATRMSPEPASSLRGFKAEYFAKEDLSGPILTRIQTQQNEPLPEGTRSLRWSGYFTPSAPGAFEIFVKTPGYDRAFHRLYVDGRLIMDSWIYSLALVDHQRIQLDARPHHIVVERCEREYDLLPNLRFGLRARGSELDGPTRDMVSKADAVVLAMGFSPESECEGADRTYSLPPGQEDLIQAVLELNPKVILVMTSGGSMNLAPFLDRIPAYIQAWYSGQEGGAALAEILLGEVSPSGRLPISWERQWEDSPTFDTYYPQMGPHQTYHKAGLFMGYRYFDRAKTKPLFPFGFGLSYSTFRYGNLKIKALRGSHRFEVGFDITNTGRCKAADVAQIYVGSAHSGVSRPEKELKGFAKLMLEPGETRRAHVTLDARAFSFWDLQSHTWRVEGGKHAILVGRSSQQIELRGEIKLDGH